MFIARVDDAARVVGIVELDDVIAGHVRGAIELLAQRRVEPPPQFLATCQTPTDADIVGKEAHHCVEVAHIERQTVFGRQLTDLVDRIEAI